MKKRKIVPLLLSAALVLGAAGCSVPSSAPGAAEESESRREETVGTVQTESAVQSSAEAAGKYAEVLRVGTTKPADIFNLTDTNGSFGKMNYNSFVGAQFLDLDVEGKIRPHLMKTWEIAPDNKSIVATFATDEGVTWHDGVPLTIDDIIFTMEYYVDPMKYKYFETVTSVEKINDTTLKLNFDEPAAFTELIRIAHFAFAIPKHIWEGIENPLEYAGEDAVIGCGPYRLTDIDRDAQVVTFEAVDNYFLGELTVKKVIMRTYDSHDALVMALRSGEIDAVYDYSNALDASMKPSLTGIDGIDPGMSTNPGHFQMTFGFNAAPTNDLSFRQAVAAALDYELLATSIGGEDGEVAGTGIVSPTALGYDPSFPLNARDLEKSMSILDAAGYVDIDDDGIRESPEGEPLDVLVTPQFNKTRSALYLRICEIVISNLKDVGVNAVLDEESVRNQDYEAEVRSSGMCQIYIGYTSPGVAQFQSAFLYMIDQGNSSWGTCRDEKLIEAYEKMLTADSYETYYRHSKEAQTIAAEEVVGIALCWDKAYFPYSTKYKGWTNSPGWGAVNADTWYNIRPE